MSETPDDVELARTPPNREPGAPKLALAGTRASEGAAPCPWRPPIGRCLKLRGHPSPHWLEVEQAQFERLLAAVETAR